MKIEYSPQAEADFDEILLYGCSHWGVEAGLAFVDALKNTLRPLLDFPELGKVYDLENLTKDRQNLRIITHGNYQITYEISGDVIRIHAIIPKGRPHEEN